MKKWTPVNFLSDVLDERSTFRPTYVMVYILIGGKHSCVNLTVSPLVILGIEVLLVGHTTFNVMSSKVVKQEKMYYDNQYVSIPFAFDTFGFLVPEVVGLLHIVQRIMHNNVMSFR